MQTFTTWTHKYTHLHFRILSANQLPCALILHEYSGTLSVSHCDLVNDQPLLRPFSSLKPPSRRLHDQGPLLFQSTSTQKGVSLVLTSHDKQEPRTTEGPAALCLYGHISALCIPAGIQTIRHGTPAVCYGKLPSLTCVCCPKEGSFEFRFTVR